jgi:hypothetical protein
MERKRANERRRTRRKRGIPEDAPVQDPKLNLKQYRTN